MEKEKILSTLHKEYPKLKHYLTFSNPYELLVATILSAQVKDTVVNETTPVLFKKYPKAADLANGDEDVILEIIRKITFAGNKAGYIKKAAQMLVEKYSGEVPKTVEELVELPGIGKKTAHAILQNAFNIVEGVVVDTHVLRVSYRLGLTTHAKNADKVERELRECLPREEWKTWPWLMKEHGRAVCKAPVPVCSSCVVKDFCDRVGVEKSK